jgi:hypothetical protein
VESVAESVAESAAESAAGCESRGVDVEVPQPIVSRIAAKQQPVETKRTVSFIRGNSFVRQAYQYAGYHRKSRPGNASPPQIFFSRQFNIVRGLTKRVLVSQHNPSRSKIQTHTRKVYDDVRIRPDLSAHRRHLARLASVPLQRLRQTGPLV